jgi:hypothetical protein
MLVRLTSRLTNGPLGNVEEALSTLRHDIRALIKDNHGSHRVGCHCKCTPVLVHGRSRTYDVPKSGLQTNSFSRANIIIVQVWVRKRGCGWVMVFSVDALGT